MNIEVTRFHRLRLLTWALIGADCHNSSTHGTYTQKEEKRGAILQTPTSHASSARTADPKPDLSAPPEVYVECAFKATMDLNAEAQCS